MIQYIGKARAPSNVYKYYHGISSTQISSTRTIQSCRPRKRLHYGEPRALHKALPGGSPGAQPPRVRASAHEPENTQNKEEIKNSAKPRTLSCLFFCVSSDAVIQKNQ